MRKSDFSRVCEAGIAICSFLNNLNFYTGSSLSQNVGIMGEKRLVTGVKRHHQINHKKLRIGLRRHGIYFQTSEKYLPQKKKVR